MMSNRLLVLADILRDHCDNCDGATVPATLVSMAADELEDIAGGQAMLEDTLSLVLEAAAGAAMAGPDAAHQLDGVADAFADAETGPGNMYLETAELKGLVTFFRALACHIRAALPPATPAPVGANGAVIQLRDFRPEKGGLL